MIVIALGFRGTVSLGIIERGYREATKLFVKIEFPSRRNSSSLSQTGTLGRRGDLAMKSHSFSESFQEIHANKKAQLAQERAVPHF